jgi:diguanylate cyclase (GGDEF)-like protein
MSRRRNGVTREAKVTSTSSPRKRLSALDETRRESHDRVVNATVDASAIDAPPTQPDPMDAVLVATRALLWITSPSDASVVACDLVGALGGQVVPADVAGPDGMPVDVSLGEGPPLLPSATVGSLERELLARHLPGFVRDAHRAIELVERTTRLADDASLDALTGLANRRMLGRALGRMRPGDTVIMLDLDHFKAVNDTLGHHEGDVVLRAFGHTIARCLRATDRAGRYGGEEFVVLLPGAAGANEFLGRLRAAWLEVRPHPISFSAGFAEVRGESVDALESADQAMYRAKASGRDRWCEASESATP